MGTQSSAKAIKIIAVSIHSALLITSHLLRARQSAVAIVAQELQKRCRNQTVKSRAFGVSPDGVVGATYPKTLPGFPFSIHRQRSF